MVGKNRSTVTNSLRLLELGIEAKQHLLTRTISEGHARVLLRFKDEEKQKDLLTKIVTLNLSVREAEVLASKAPSHKKPAKTYSLSNCKYPTFYLNNNGKGKFVIKFDTETQFQELQKLLENA